MQKDLEGSTCVPVMSLGVCGGTADATYWSEGQGAKRLLDFYLFVLCRAVTMPGIVSRKNKWMNTRKNTRKRNPRTSPKHTLQRKKPPLSHLRSSQAAQHRGFESGLCWSLYKRMLCLPPELVPATQRVSGHWSPWRALSPVRNRSCFEGVCRGCRLTHEGALGARVRGCPTVRLFVCFYDFQLNSSVCPAAEEGMQGLLSPEAFYCHSPYLFGEKPDCRDAQRLCWGQGCPLATARGIFHSETGSLHPAPAFPCSLLPCALLQALLCFTAPCTWPCKAVSSRTRRR